MKKKILIAALLGLFLFIPENISAQLADSPWPTFHGNSQRTGLSPYDTSHIGGTIKWMFETENGLEASPVIGPDGTIYTGSHDGYLYSIKPDGKLNWKYKIGTPLEKKFGGDVSYTSTLSTPSITKDGIIYITSRDQYLYAISKEGKEIWKFPVNISFDHWASPAVADDGTIYVVSSKPRAGLIAITPKGKEKWYYKAETNAFNSPAIGKDGTIYVGLPINMRVNALVAINPDGTEKWKTQTKHFLESTPSIADDGTIYIGSFSETGSGAGMYAFSSNGKIKWHFGVSFIREVMSTPAIGKDGTIYIGMYEGIFYAINPDGTEKWKMEIEGEIGSSAAIGAEGTIHVGFSIRDREEYGFYAFNPDGSVKWKALKDGNIVSSPAIGKDGTIYVGSWDGKLYAIGGPEKEKNPEKSATESATEKPKEKGIRTIYYVVGAAAFVTITMASVGIIIFLRKKRGHSN